MLPHETIGGLFLLGNPLCTIGVHQLEEGPGPIRFFLFHGSPEGLAVDPRIGQKVVLQSLTCSWQHTIAAMVAWPPLTTLRGAVRSFEWMADEILIPGAAHLRPGEFEDYLGRPFPGVEGSGS